MSEAVKNLPPGAIHKQSRPVTTLPGPRSLAERIPLVSVFLKVFRILPTLVPTALIAVLIARFVYHANGGQAVAGAAVPLISFFLVTRVLVAALPERDPEIRPPRRGLKPIVAVAGTAFFAGGLGASTFALSALTFWKLHMQSAMGNAIIASRTMGYFCLLGFLLLVGISFYEVAWPEIKPMGRRVLQDASELCRSTFVRIAEGLLIFPTSIADMIRLPQHHMRVIR